MPSSNLCLVGLSLFACFACRSLGREIESLDQVGDEAALVYDGATEVMEALPDCNTESLGTLFWVRGVATGYECTADQKWTPRSTRKPD